MQELTYPHVAVLLVELHIEASQSLKAKRGVIKRVLGQIRSKFGVSVAEVGFHDQWQRSIVGVSVLGLDHRNSSKDRAIRRLLRKGYYLGLEY